MKDTPLASSKFCAGCQLNKLRSEFYSCKRYKDGLRTQCKSCESKRAKKWGSENADRKRDAKRNWDEQNEKHRIAYRKQYVLDNQDSIREKARVAAAKRRLESPEIVRASQLTYKQANREKLREKSREWARLNPERNRQRARQWAEQNNARFMARVLAYDKAHPELKRARKILRDRSLSQARMSWGNRFFISEIYDLARLRTIATGMKWEVDHIVPIRSEKVCGLHVYWNLAVVPARLNRRKSNRYWPDMP